MKKKNTDKKVYRRNNVTMKIIQIQKKYTFRKKYTISKNNSILE